MYLGDFALGSTFYFKFTTRRFTTGVPYTLAGSPSLRAYINASDTQVTTGLTLTVDFDGITGYNHVTVVATSGNGYSSGDWSVVIAAGTIDSVSVVGEHIGYFSIDSTSRNTPSNSTGCGGFGPV